MRITLDIPDSVAERLREFVGPDLGRAAIESLALEGYKSDKLTQYEVRLLLGHESRWDTEQWLGRHGAHLNWTQADLDEEFRAVDRYLSERKA